MKRKPLLVRIVMIISVTIFLFLAFIIPKKTLEYDDYEKMELLSQKSERQLEKEGYFDLDIRKIKDFKVNYQNHLALKKIVENDHLKNYGYHNIILKNGEKPNFSYEKNYFTIQNDHLSYHTSITDFGRYGDSPRDSARIVIEFEWKNKPDIRKQAIKVIYHHYVLDNIYTLLKYENPKDQTDFVYKMAEIEPNHYLDEFYTVIDAVKKINHQKYVLKSGIIVLDIKSYYVDSGIAPLNITSQFIMKSLFGKDKVLTEQKIFNAEINVQSSFIQRSFFQMTDWD